ncbi:hypothetical protein [Haematobacter missouriensis]|nr:hypothetical protein [Haematobacter missouriensis]
MKRRTLVHVAVAAPLAGFIHRHTFPDAEARPLPSEVDPHPQGGAAVPRKDTPVMQWFARGGPVAQPQRATGALGRGPRLGVRHRLHRSRPSRSTGGQDMITDSDIAYIDRTERAVSFAYTASGLVTAARLALESNTGASEGESAQWAVALTLELAEVFMGAVIDGMELAGMKP